MDFKLRWALNDEMVQRLRRDFNPLLPASNSNISFPVGWEKVVRRALEKFAENKNDSNALRVEQIKDKFGGLRIYTNFTSEKIQAIIAYAEDEADNTCMECGYNGDTVVEHPRYQVLCKKCALFDREAIRKASE